MFDPYAKLAEIMRQAVAIPAQPARPVSQMSQANDPGKPACRVAEVASVATPPRSAPEPAPRARPKLDAGGFPYGTACNLGDAPRTWTGRIVSLEDWRTLSAWEKHGPDGQHWCGLCWCWHFPGQYHGGTV